MRIKLLSLFIATSISFSSISQCVVINEIMINAAGASDGQNSPNTEEWLELYNTCSNAVDIGCFVITDGDFTITIPEGTMLGANDYYLIGSGASGLTLDLNWASCGCTNGTNIGIFTNGTEQVILTDGAGTTQDAIQWGGGQFPVTITSLTLGSCAAVSFNVTNPTTEFETLPGGGGNGCSLARTCDGAQGWSERCTTFPSPGLTNNVNDITVDFLSSDPNICAGQCLEFVDLSSIIPDSWNWQFEGSDTPTSSDQNPANICYSAPGVYDVTLTLINACGSYTYTSENLVNVVPGEIPIVTYSGPTTFCEGGSLLLQTTSAGSFQWNLDGDPIPGAIQNSYYATQSGSYTLTLGNGACQGESAEVIVEVDELNAAIISPAGTIDICFGESLTLNVNDDFDSYNWYLNDQLLNTTTEPMIAVTEPGSYYVIAMNGACMSTSNDVVVNVLSQLSVSINPTPSISICVGEEANITATAGFGTYDWYQDDVLISTQSSPTLTVNDSGTYYVVATSGNCTATSSATTVNVVNPPIVSISPQNSITLCGGETEDLTATAGFSNYTWSQGNTVVGITQVLEVSTAGVYSVTVIENGCSASAEVQVNVVNLETPVITASNDQFIFCVGSSLNLTTTNDYESYQWYFNDTPIATSANINVNEEGNYYVVASTGNCQGISQSVDVLEVQLPSISINPSGTVEFCGNQATLYATGSADVIQWLYNSNPMIGQNNSTLNVTTSGNYQVLASTIEGCTALSNSVAVELIAPIDVNLSYSPQVGCEGDPITISATGNFESYQWSTGGTVSTIIVNQSGQYSVTVTEGPCTVVETIGIDLNPIPLVDAGLDTVADCYLGVTLYGSGEGDLYWEQDGSVDLPESPITPVHPEHTTVYTLVSTLDGCTATDQVLVIADCEVVKVPNVFTPNGDGKNDTFEVVVVGIESYGIKIFDRWGVLVFESTDPDRQWTGSVNGGDATEGTYYYIIEAMKYDGNPFSTKGIKGALTLLR